MQLQYYAKIDTEFSRLSSNRVSLIRFRSPVNSLSAKVLSPLSLSLSLSLSLRGYSSIRKSREFGEDSVPTHSVVGMQF